MRSVWILVFISHLLIKLSIKKWCSKVQPHKNTKLEYKWLRKCCDSGERRVAEPNLAFFNKLFSHELNS